MNVCWKKFIWCFCSVEFNLKAGLFCRNGGILLLREKCRMWGVSELLTSEVDVLLDGMSGPISPGASVARTVFIVSSSARHEPWSGEFILWAYVPIAARKKEPVAESCSSIFHGDSFMWLCDVAESCIWYRLSSFESQHKVWLVKGAYRNKQFL